MLANPGQDSEPRPKVLQLTEDDDGGDLSDDRNCDAYPDQSEHSARLPEYAGHHSPMGIQAKTDFREDFIKVKTAIES
jgi:hypothetical protein